MKKEAMSRVLPTRGSSKINALEIREGESVYHRVPRRLFFVTNDKRLENRVWRLLINLLEHWVIISWGVV